METLSDCRMVVQLSDLLPSSHVQNYTQSHKANSHRIPITIDDHLRRDCQKGVRLGPQFSAQRDVCHHDSKSRRSRRNMSSVGNTTSRIWDAVKSFPLPSASGQYKSDCDIRSIKRVDHAVNRASMTSEDSAEQVAQAVAKSEQGKRIPIYIDDHVPRDDFHKIDALATQSVNSWNEGVYQSQSDGVQFIKVHTKDRVSTTREGLADTVSTTSEGSTGCGQDTTTSEGSAETDANIVRDVHNFDNRKDKQGIVGGKTMMICNIPCRVSQDDLIDAIESSGFASTFDSVYMPHRFGQSNSNLGYAFVHFYLWEDAACFALAFEGYRFTSKGSTKACTVKVASCQGSNGSRRRLPRRLRVNQRECEVA
mmetsp:Transcript_123971/g.193512  ORF Transcript_123971/g.193512 Transcript_123971/m.193512 type:complete len:366 (-) Transcript_123971:82-1179(-)